VTALLTRKTAVRGTAKIDWNDHNFLEILRKCWAAAVRKVSVLQMSRSKSLEIASRISKYFSKLWPCVLWE